MTNQYIGKDVGYHINVFFSVLLSKNIDLHINQPSVLHFRTRVFSHYTPIYCIIPYRFILAKSSILFLLCIFLLYFNSAFYVSTIFSFFYRFNPIVPIKLWNKGRTERDCFKILSYDLGGGTLKVYTGSNAVYDLHQWSTWWYQFPNRYLCRWLLLLLAPAPVICSWKDLQYVLNWGRG